MVTAFDHLDRYANVRSSLIADVHHLQTLHVFETPSLVDIKHKCLPVARLFRAVACGVPEEALFLLRFDGLCHLPRGVVAT